MNRELNAIFAIATRDFTKFIRDRMRIIFTFVFPAIFVGVLGGSLQASFGKVTGINFLEFALTGSLAQTLFQSTASGIISLISDRESDFSQEMFVSPISRYTIIVGKVLGESLISFTQAGGILLLGYVFGVHLSLQSLISFIPAGIAICLLGGAFGVLVLANLGSQRSANQIFPFVMFPQFFLGGVFSPIKDLPIYLFIASRLAPMTYVVDFGRNILYFGKPEASKVLLYPIWLDLAVMAGMFFVFMTLGTYLFVKNERNR